MTAKISTTTKKHSSKTSLQLHRLHFDLSSEEYHSLPGSYSSTQIKDLLGDPEYFYKKHVTKEIGRESIAAFDVGSYYHCGVLEPHKLKEECAIYPGPVRRGAEWEAFFEKHKGKTIVTRNDQKAAELLIETTKKSTITMELVRVGRPEVSMFVSLVVSNGIIFAPNIDSYLTPNGWVKYDFGFIPQGRTLIIKVRADSLTEIPGRLAILDLKSTTGDAKDARTTKQKVSNYNYDLSAALYLDMFTAGTGQNYETFLWSFASKDYQNCKVWVASQENIRIGRAKWSSCILKLAKCLDREWKFDEEIGVLEPNFFEREHLIQDDSELL